MVRLGEEKLKILFLVLIVQYYCSCNHDATNLFILFMQLRMHLLAEQEIKEFLTRLLE